MPFEDIHRGRVPIIDLADADVETVARRLDAACREHGFFVVTGHGIDRDCFDRLEASAAEFFALEPAVKAEIAMARGGPAWRGWFPPGGELTSGVPDGKEGIYFGRELGPDDARVRAGTPLHGANLFPAAPAALGPVVLDVLDRLTALGHRLCSLLAVGLGLDADWFDRTLLADPTILFRIFHYPAVGAVDGAAWGVAEHTDYGLLTILRQDDVGGLQVRSGASWLDVDPVPDSFVCNIGDMLERMTGGAYRSTPHRVRTPDRSRLSFPFFFDPSWDARVPVLPGVGAGTDVDRWDGASVFAGDVTYGEYLTSRVAKVFPDLWGTVSDQDSPTTSLPKTS